MRTWQHHVDAFIALTPFQKDKMIDAGLPRKKVHIKPHFFSNPADSIPWGIRNSHIVYIGRLGEEKGVINLIDSWKLWGDDAPPLNIIGNGPLRKELQTKTKQAGLANKINFLGQLSFIDTQAHLGRVRMLILPSLCFEGFPMVIREAFALGVPVAASRLGSLPCIIEDGQNGVLFSPGNPKDLLRKVKKAWNSQDRLSLMSDNARRTFEQNYTSQINYKKLIEIYSAAMENKKRRKSVS
jgi:glycosyltransferase involved in cell wall biosynthesis